MFTIYANGELIYSPNNKTLLVTQPKLTLEMGKAGSLDFHVPPTHPFYEQLGRISTKVSVLEDEETELFRGRVLSNEREFHNIRSVFCEGDLAYLVDSVQKAEKFTGKTHALFRKIIAAHNARMSSDKQFTVGTIGIEDRDIILTGQSDEEVNVGPIDYRQIVVNSVVDNWNTTYDFIQTSLIDYAGGYLRTRRANGVSYIDLVTSYGTAATQEIRIDTNMLDFLESISPEDLFTVLIPLGDDNLTIAEANNGSDELVDAAAVAKYGRIVRTQVFPNVNQASTLLENGQRYLANNINVPKTFTIQAVDLHLLNPDVQPIHVGDRVKIVSEAHDVTEYMVCTKIEYDLSNPANTVYTFGNPKQTLTDRYREDKRKASDTYGPGGTGSSAASAATHDWHLVDEMVAEGVEAAVEQANEDADDKITESYDAWVKWDSGKATIDLGTLYKRFKGVDLEQFTTNGINFNGPTGTVNIFADHELYENDRATLKNHLGIDLDSIAGTIDIFSDHEQWEDDRTTLKNRVGINLDAPAGTIDIFTTASIADSNNTAIASIKLRAGVNDDGNLGSAIALNADVVEVQNKLSAVTVDAGHVYVDAYLQASGVYADSFLIGSGGAYYSMSLHTHEISEENGVVTIGEADWTGANHSFNIADTNFYKDGVSAVHVLSLQIDPEDQTDYLKYDANGKGYIQYPYLITLSNTGTNATYRGTINTSTKAWDAVTVSSVTNGGRGQYYWGNDDQLYCSITANAAASNGKTGSGTLTFGVQDIYDYGKNAGETSGANSVTISSVTNGGRGQYYWGNDDQLYCSITANAAASNGKTGSGTLTFGVQDIYNAGRSSVSQRYIYSVYALASYGWKRSDGEGGYVVGTTVRVTLSDGAYGDFSIQFAA